MGKEKKEIGMQKLIELLNEYDNRNDTIKDTIQYRFHNGYIQRGVKGIDKRANVWWYSKSFGFIKWLVENDKIDTDPIRTRVKRVYVELEPREFTPQDFTDRVIMLLSISDTPIDFLCEILK